jgi:hypothetical protein
MIKNCRTGLLWGLMRRCPPVVTGQRRAGFTGGQRRKTGALVTIEEHP